MPFNPKSLPSDLKKKIKKRHPAAGEKEYRQFAYVFNNAMEEGQSEAKAFAKAWGVLNQNKKLKNSHRDTESAETKKNVKAWGKEHKWKDKKSQGLIELASILLKQGLYQEGLDVLDLMSSDSDEDLSLVDVSEYGFKTDARWMVDGKNIKLRDDVLESLKKAEDNLPDGYEFLILYGYRTLDEQRKIVKTQEKELKETNPDDWREKLKTYTGGYDELELDLDDISYLNHRSGRSVDLTLLYHGDEVEMGLDDDGNANMDSSDRLDSSDVSMDIKENRKIFADALSAEGFENYKEEWWHWGLKENNSDISNLELFEDVDGFYHKTKDSVKLGNKLLRDSNTFLLEGKRDFTIKEYDETKTDRRKDGSS